MEQRRWTVRTTASFDRWVGKLKDRGAVAAIASRVRRVQAGLFGDVRDVGEGVFELRVDYGPGYRVYAMRAGEVVIVLLCGGDKGSQSRDIAKAKLMASTVRGKGRLK